MPTSIVLPCGKTATVGELTGKAQKHINDALQSMEGGATPALDWEDRVFAEVVQSLGSRPPRPRDLLDLATGSRKRLMIATRRLTYGDEVELTWTCPGTRRVPCGHANAAPFSLADLVDRPFVPEAVRFRASDDTVFTLGWGTGHTERAFAVGSAKRELGFPDEPLTRILQVNGEPRGLREILKLSAKVLDEVRAAGRAMVPVHDPEAGADALPTDGDEPPREGAPLALVDDVVTEPARMPRAGCAERVRMACERCGHRMGVPITSQMDFLLRGVSGALED